MNASAERKAYWAVRFSDEAAGRAVARNRADDEAESLFYMGAGGLLRVPDTVLAPDTLLPVAISGEESRRRTLPLPIEGGRVALAAGSRPLGWLDLWGNGGYANAEARQGLTDFGRLIAHLLVGVGQGARPRG